MVEKLLMLNNLKSTQEYQKKSRLIFKIQKIY